MKLSVLLLVALLGVSSWAVVASTEKTELSQPPTLAEKIEAACTRPGYSATDWTVGDEWEPVPEGFVKVTCMNKNFDTYKTVVSR